MRAARTAEREPVAALAEQGDRTEAEDKGGGASAYASAYARRDGCAIPVDRLGELHLHLAEELELLDRREKPRDRREREAEGIKIRELGHLERLGRIVEPLAAGFCCGSC